ncbi:MAG: alpha/beta fold hydrolase [Vicinamibacterales bacterium]
MVTSVVLLLVAAPVAAYFLADPERLDLDEAARQKAPGKFVRLTDGYTHYEIEGPETGRIVVLAAGFSVPYYIWDPTFTALTRAGFRVVRYDYYGRGYSDRPDASYTQDFYIRQLTELLGALKITGPMDLVGLSFGGSVVTTFADRYPDRVRSLVYIDPSFRSPGALPALANLPLAWNYFTAVFDERWWADAQPRDFLEPGRFPDWADRYRVQVQYRGFRRARLSELVSNASVDQRDEIARVGEHPRPVFVIWGKQDPSVPFEFSTSLLELMPQGRLLAVESSGHLPQIEQPAVVNPALIDFLREVR